jgi:hypothetical protein
MLSNLLQGSVAEAAVCNDRLTPEARDLRLQADCVAEAVLGLDVQSGGIHYGLLQGYSVGCHGPWW